MAYFFAFIIIAVIEVLIIRVELSPPGWENDENEKKIVDAENSAAKEGSTDGNNANR